MSKIRNLVFGCAMGIASAVGRLGAVLSSFTGVMSLEYGASLGFFGLVAVLLFICGIAGWATRVGRAQHDAPLAAEA